MPEPDIRNIWIKPNHENRNPVANMDIALQESERRRELDKSPIITQTLVPLELLLGLLMRLPIL